MKHEGGRLIALGSGLALLVSIYNYVRPVAFLAPDSAIAGTPAAALAIFATLCLLLAGLVLAGRARNFALILFFLVGSLIAILGTGLVGWLVEVPAIMGLMAVCMVGWLLRVFASPDPDDRRSRTAMGRV